MFIVYVYHQMMAGDQGGADAGEEAYHSSHCWERVQLAARVGVVVVLVEMFAGESRKSFKLMLQRARNSASAKRGQPHCAEDDKAEPQDPVRLIKIRSIR